MTSPTGSERRSPGHPLRRAKDYHPDGVTRRRRWIGPERSYRLTYRRRPLTTLASTIVAILLPATIVIAGTKLAPIQTVQPAPRVVTGLTIPWAAGGLRYDASGKLENFVGEWPSFPVEAVRFWDTRTAWLNIEPVKDQWEWAVLDKNFAIANDHGVTDITMVLWGTPKWAASSLDPNDAPWMGPGSAAPPTDLADWDSFVTHVAQRYAGRVTAYEIGNEPNLRTFWRGTPEQLAEMVTRAAAIIHHVDPSALVVAPAPYVQSPQDVISFAPYFNALADSPAKVDVLAYHWYPSSLDINGLDYTWTQMRRHAVKAGLTALPIWVTEAGFQQQHSATASAMLTLIPETLSMAQGLGIARIYFYAWTDLPIGDLIQLHSGSALETGLVATLP